MRINCFQLNTGLAIYAKPQCVVASLMHVNVITRTSASRPEGASIL